MDWWIVAIIVSQLAFVAFLIGLAVNYRQKIVLRRSKERLRVLERFDSGEQLTEFLATERGGEFLHLFAVKPGNPARLILTGIAIAILAGFVGVALGLLSWLDAQDMGHEYMVASVLVLATALGILAASAVSLRLARNLGVLPSPSEASRTSPSEASRTSPSEASRTERGL